MPSNFSSVVKANTPPSTDLQRRDQLSPPAIAVGGLSPNTIRRGSFPLDHSESNKGLNSFDSSPRTQARTLYGIPLGTPAAKEAAKSFWTMDQLQESLEKIAQYTSEQSSSPTASLTSLSTSSYSVDFDSRPMSAVSIHEHTLTPPHPPITVSAPTTPRVSHKEGTVSPLTQVVARRGDKAATSLPGSLISSPRLLGSSPRRSTPPYLSPGITRKREELKPSLSVEGKQMKLSVRNNSSLWTQSPPLRSASACAVLIND